MPGLTEAGRKNIIGIESPVWTEYIDNNETLEQLLFPRLIAVSKVALGENSKPYTEFLNDVNTVKNEFDGYSFCNEKEWTKPRAAFIYGWLKFVKDRYSLNFIKEQLL